MVLTYYVSHAKRSISGSKYYIMTNSGTLGISAWIVCIPQIYKWNYENYRKSYALARNLSGSPKFLKMIVIPIK